MIDLSTPNEWQHKDESLGGILFPWYTKSFLDELVTWDLKEKVVFEYGCGASSLWWNKKCKKLYGVESNPDYHAAVVNAMWPKALIVLPLEEGEQAYANAIKYCCEQFDIIIIDGEPIAWRDDCVKPAIDCLIPGGKLIIDNWMQPSVGWLPSEETQQLLSQYPGQVYPQEGHPDWKTAVFTII